MPGWRTTARKYWGGKLSVLMWISLTTGSPSPVELDRSRYSSPNIGFSSGREVSSGVGGGVGSGGFGVGGGVGSGGSGVGGGVDLEVGPGVA